MLKMFGGKPDHPLADPKEARRMFDALPANDPVKALDELMHWMESVAAIEGFKPEARAQLLLQIDDAAQARVRKLAKDYFADARPSRFQENRLWTALHGWWKQAGYAYARAVDQFQNVKPADAAKGVLPQLLVRALRSFAQHIKWMHMRYGPVDPASWGVFNSLYAFAEARQIAQAKTAVYAGTPGDSTPHLEFLRGVMFSASAPDGLLPVEVELTERFIAEFAPRFALANALGPDHVFCIDLAQPKPPMRAAKAAQQGPTQRFVGAGAALAEIQALSERLLTGGQLPPSLNLGGNYEPEMVREVLEHMLMYWSAQPPERKSQRHPVKTRLAVTHGYDSVLGVLGGSDSLDFENKDSESWIVENVSAGGFGAVVPQLKGDWLRVGALLALQPQGGANWVLGLVRRVNKLGPAQARVGIETLSKMPEVTQFAVSGAKGAQAAGVLLKNGESAEARIVLRPGVFAPAQNLELARGERHHVYIPQAVAERGEDYEIARFREMVRES